MVTLIKYRCFLEVDVTIEAQSEEDARRCAMESIDPGEWTVVRDVDQGAKE